jgi:carbamoylphosphate synthase large subunit
MASHTILVTCVGSGGANNLIRSIRSSKYGEETTIIGVDANKYLVNKSLADENYVVPRGSEDEYIDALNTAIDRHGVELVIAQHESEIRTVSERRNELHAPVLLPKHETVELCLDKYELNSRLEKLGFPVPETVSLRDVSVDEAFECLAPDGHPLWCRTRYGSSSFEAQPMYSREQAKQWITYWNERGGLPSDSFTFSEFLPGRDYHILTFWNDGNLVLGKGNERNEYFFGQNTGVATPLVGRQLYYEELNETCTAITKALDENAMGNWGFDFKEDRNGTPKLTEINIGKFSMVNYFFNMAGEFNMAELYLDVAFGNKNELPDLEDPYCDVDTDLFLSRGIDLEPEIFSVDEIDGVENLS